ncbi:protein SSX1 [Orycteropus afer afer]|uniref:Protein SSX1 n=1 Tax=Orycteropus afer afer TaxID=1230840 RepID=A0A8B7BCN6_ORYAF|nr:protein SSX1 [Orycteropus afer afer]
MNRGNFGAKSSKEDTRKPEKKSKAFKDISRYFSKEEWAELRYSEKVTYVYMKRNYDAMTNLGLRATLPHFMSPNRWTTKSQLDDSNEYHNLWTEEPKKEETKVWACRLRERKNLIVYEEISDPEEED